VNYGGARMSQMLAELVLQFSVLCFCERRKKKQKKKEKLLSSMQASSCRSAAPRLLGLFCAIKTQFKGLLLFFMCALYIGNILVGKKAGLPDPCYHENEVCF
jgi:hypothetical protein